MYELKLTGKCVDYLKPYILFKLRSTSVLLCGDSGPCNVGGLTIKFANSPPCACRGSSGQKPQYGLMMLAYQVYYLEVLKRLCEKVRRKRPELLPTTHGSFITTMHLLIWHCL
jgi:hypothetical protein